MLNQNSTGIDREKRTRTTQIRHGESLATLIDRATSVLGVEKSVFLRSAIAKEANRVLEENSRHLMTREDAAAFTAALDTPSEPTQRALDAGDEFARRVNRAD